jgi:hypothetical protein
MTLKEGIDNSQWKKIEDVLKVQRVRKGATSSPRPPHDIQKWFEIWKILFPDAREPESPCRFMFWCCNTSKLTLHAGNEPSDAYPQLERSAEELLAEFERVTEQNYMLRTSLDPGETRQYYIDALRQLLGLDTGVDTDAERSEPGASESAIHSIHHVSPDASNDINLNRTQEPGSSHFGNEYLQDHGVFPTMQPTTPHSAVDLDLATSQTRQEYFSEVSSPQNFSNDDLTGILETSDTDMPFAFSGFDHSFDRLPPLLENPLETIQEQTRNAIDSDIDCSTTDFMDPSAINAFPLDHNVHFMTDFESNGFHNIWDLAANNSLSAFLDGEHQMAIAKAQLRDRKELKKGPALP